MPWKRAVVGWLLVVLYLAIIGGAAFGAPDFSWSPGFFDDDDSDDVFFLLSNQSPALAVPAVVLLSFISAQAALVLLRPSTCVLLAPAPSRLRAPPLV